MPGERVATVKIAMGLVSEHIANVEAAVRADEMKWDFAFFQKTDEKLAGHAENLGGFDGCELVAVLQHRNGMAGQELGKQAKQEGIGVVGQTFGFAVGTSKLGLGRAELGINLGEFLQLG